MNLDLLKKLTRLANNNPNDNEANLAARRVCKMLEESNWSFSSNDTNSSTPKQSSDTITWNDVRRTTEPFWRSSRPFDPNSWTGFGRNSWKEPPQYDHAAAERERIRKEQERKREEDARKTREADKKFWEDYFRPTEQQRKFYEDFIKQQERENRSSFFSGGFDYSGRPIREQKPKRILKCTVCGSDVETGYVGNLFVCNPCQWTEYLKNRKKAEGE